MATTKRWTVETIESLQQKDARKTEFFMAASHQLKSPVAAVQWCLQSVLESPTLKGKDRELIMKALKQADGMGHLIKDMLHLFRLESHKDWQKEFAPVNVNELLEQLIVQYEEVAHKKKVRLARGPIAHLPQVLAQEDYLRQVFTNLLDNAVKYTPPGQTVTVRAELARGHELQVEVEDQGIGMTEADQAKLFTEFFRSEAAQEMTAEGSGLGLVLVKNIVQEFGGEIQVKSKFGKGSTFTVRLPGIA